ncbi:hypothetical protein [Sporosarcina sp. FSL K6-1508]|uniref:hypothetical protein n=1 Tax=Sporosarcina sp. FSL K6-1508 TaxID=2921553 RepID=UPI0030FBDFAB
MDFNLIIVAVATLFGSLGSSFLVGHYNTKSQNRALKIEFQRIDEERRYQEKQKLLEVYNYVLRKNGEITIIKPVENGLFEFEISLYSKEIRFALFEEYSKLDKKVAEILTLLDKKIEESRMYYIYDDYEVQAVLEECCGIYSDLIKTINNVIDTQRERTQLRVD